MRSTAVLTVLSTLFFLGASAAPVVANLEQRSEAPCERSGSGGLLNGLSLLSGNDVGMSLPLPVPSRMPFRPLCDQPAPS